MKKIYVIVGLVFILFNSNVYSQRIWSSPLGQYAFNPAGGGMNDIGEISSCYYNTYGSANNNPFGFLFMGTAPFPSDNIAAGFRFTSESGGVLNSTMGEATFIYHRPIFENAKFSFGLSAVFNQLGILRNRVNAQHPDDIILNGAKTGFWGDANFGASMYETNKYYVGIGIYNLLGGRTNLLVTDFNNRAARLYTLSGMYTINVLQGDGKLEMTGLAMSYFSKGSSDINYNINSRIIIKKSFWVGGGYAPNTAKLQFGVYFQNFAIGYSGGIGLGDISNHTFSLPKHELFLKIEFNNSQSSISVK
ncbi:MAG: PorP/SprF family type IX secretion system membrane protein [Bacteroidota bacterium]